MKLANGAVAQHVLTVLREAAGVGHQVPVARKAHQALHGGEVDAAVASTV
jgi:hypothetical protein